MAWNSGLVTGAGMYATGLTVGTQERQLGFREAISRAESTSGTPCTPRSSLTALQPEPVTGSQSKYENDSWNGEGRAQYRHHNSLTGPCTRVQYLPECSTLDWKLNCTCLHGTGSRWPHRSRTYLNLDCQLAHQHTGELVGTVTGNDSKYGASRNA